jgi:hypothetical protein
LVWIGALARSRIAAQSRLRRKTMLNALIRRARAAATRRSRAIVAALESERGQGTVEYVGLILLVSMLMVALVAAMKGFHTSEGQDLAQLIVEKIKAAVNALTFR